MYFTYKQKQANKPHTYCINHNFSNVLNKGIHQNTFLELKCITKYSVNPYKLSMKLKGSIDSFEGFIWLHIGKNNVEEGGHSQEEHKLNPQRDEARRLGSFRGILTRPHGSWSQRVFVRGGCVVHVGPGKEERGLMLQCMIWNLIITILCDPTAVNTITYRHIRELINRQKRK